MYGLSTDASLIGRFAHKRLLSTLQSSYMPTIFNKTQDVSTKKHNEF